MAEEITVKKAESTPAKDYVLYGALAATAILAYWVFYREKTVTLDISGTEIIIVVVIGAGLFYLWNRQRSPKLLPPADVISMDGCKWLWEHGHGAADDTLAQVEPISDTEALCYFPNIGKTLQYDANKGIVGIKHKDLEQTIRIKESHDIVKSFTQQKQGKERLAAELASRGFPVDVQ